MNFSEYMPKPPEERKGAAAHAPNPNEKVPMSSFMRNVHSKQDLLYALSVKGKYPSTADFSIM